MTRVHSMTVTANMALLNMAGTSIAVCCSNRGEPHLSPQALQQCAMHTTLALT